MTKRKTHDEFVKQLNKIHGDGTYTPLEEYINNKTKILVRHNQCGHEWNIIPSNILKGQGCPKCAIKTQARNRRKTHEKFIQEIKDKYDNEYKVLGEYKNAKTKILIRHKCGYEYRIIPDSLLRGGGCPKCAGVVKKTTKEFKKEIYNKYGNEYEVLGEYVNNHTKILVKHNCSHKWMVAPNKILQGRGCPVCRKEKRVASRTKTHEEFIQEIYNKYGDEYKILGEYINAKTKIKVRHNSCGYEWKVAPYNLLNNGHGCPICGKEKRIKSRTKTTEEFVKEVKEKYGDEYTVLGDYINSSTKILVRHNCEKCNYKWEITPSNLLQGNGCPKCKNIDLSISNEEFQKMFKEKYGDEFTLLDEYKGSRDKMRIRHNCEYCGNHIRIMRADSILKRLYCKVCDGDEDNKKTINMKFKDKNIKLIEEVKTKNDKHKLICLVCGQIWESNLQNILRKGKGCPVCANKKVVKGINDIATTHPHLVKYFVNKEDAYKYSYGNGKKRVPIKCLNCGNIKYLSMNDLTRRYSEGFRCSKCSDGTSYPEKFIMNILGQLDVEFKSQYSPKWIKPKKYDFYIKDLNMIIETHGKQHYSDKTSFKICGGRTLEEEQANDKYKREIALANGIKHYIELDCRESNMEWIKNSILNSKLSELFDINKIDWTSCAEFANSNRVKEVCEYWNNRKDDETTSDVGRKFDLDRSSIVTYLKKGTKLRWCNYDPKEESFKSSSKSGKASGKNVMMLFENGDVKIFNSCHEIERLSENMFGIKIYHTYACRVAKGTIKSRKNFTFKYIEDLTPEERIKYNVDEKLKDLENKMGRIK